MRQTLFCVGGLSACLSARSNFFVLANWNDKEPKCRKNQQICGKK